MVDGFETYIIGKVDVAAEAREQRSQQRVTEGLAALTEAIDLGAPYWENLRRFGRPMGLFSPEDMAALE